MRLPWFRTSSDWTNCKVFSKSFLRSGNNGLNCTYQLEIRPYIVLRQKELLMIADPPSLILLTCWVLVGAFYGLRWKQGIR